MAMVFFAVAITKQAVEYLGDFGCNSISFSNLNFFLIFVVVQQSVFLINVLILLRINKVKRKIKGIDNNIAIPLVI